MIAKMEQQQLNLKFNSSRVLSICSSLSIIQIVEKWLWIVKCKARMNIRVILLGILKITKDKLNFWKKHSKHQLIDFQNLK